MKDWRRSPEPPGMMGMKEADYQVHGNWGPPSDPLHPDFDPASPIPHAGSTTLLLTSNSSRPLSHLARTQSLYSMALRVILRNISSVQDLGVLPYRHAKPILEECRIDQLILLEETSPHLLDHTEEIWKRNCLRDFIDLRRRYAGESQVKEPKSWRRLYFRTKGETEQAKVDAARRIKDKYEQHRAEKEAKKLVVSDRPLHKAKGSAGRRFGVSTSGMGGGGGRSKGQSLLNKARSGSAAQAKLTGRTGNAFKVQGRSKAVGVEIAPEAAGIAVNRISRPMVAPRKILGGASPGLAQMKEFSKPLPGDAAAEESKSTTRTPASTSTLRRTESSQRPDVEATQDGGANGLPRLKPRDVAAAPSLTSASIWARAAERANMNGSSASAASRSTRRIASSPPPDIARTERRQLDFFGSRAKVSPSTGGTSSSSLGRSSPSTSSSASGIDVRGVKRTHSNSVEGARSSLSRSNGATSSSSKTDTPASSPATSSFFHGKSAGGQTRVTQAQRARTQDQSSLSRSTPPPTPSHIGTQGKVSTSGASTDKQPITTSASTANGNVARTRPTSSSSGLAAGREARASSAALSSIFMPSSSPLSRSRSHGRGDRREK